MLPQAVQPYFRLAEHCVNPDVLLQPTLDAILRTHTSWEFWDLQSERGQRRPSQESYISKL